MGNFYFSMHYIILVTNKIVGRYLIEDDKRNLIVLMVFVKFGYCKNRLGLGHWFGSLGRLTYRVSDPDWDDGVGTLYYVYNNNCVVRAGKKRRTRRLQRITSTPSM